MKGGARFEVFRALGLNYYGFHVRKNKIYDRISFVVCCTLIGTSVYLGMLGMFDIIALRNLLRIHLAAIYELIALSSRAT